MIALSILPCYNDITPVNHKQEEPMQIKLGEQLRSLRHRHGRTQEELAQALGVTSQAVSRWETETCYPDLELIPSIAHFFSVSIDELFGYQDERGKRIAALANRIDELNRQNNGQDVSMDACIQLAREALAEFPGNSRLMLCLASALYNAGYVRHGERHLTDAEGYDAYDTERHKTYAEWQEAIRLYETLLPTLTEGDRRQRAMRDLLQLYANTGQWEKAARLVQALPTLSGCRELLQAHALHGSERAVAQGEALLKIAKACADLIIASVITRCHQMKPEDSAQAVRSAIAAYALVCTDERYGPHHADLVCLHLYLSEHLWLAGDRDGAFAALEQAHTHAKAFDEVCRQKTFAYTAPLLSGVKAQLPEATAPRIAPSLPEDWPWWRTPDCSQVAAEMQKDPRWTAWVEKARQ